MKRERFTATIIDGHKGAACEMPFAPPTKQVRGTLNGVEFQSSIAARSKKQWLLVSDTMLDDAGVAAGDEVAIAIDVPVMQSADKYIERVRKICLALPDTQEKVSHGEPTWFVKGRVFVMFSNNHHGDGNVAIVCNAPLGAQDSLTASEPKYFYRPPYVGGAGWIGIRVDKGLSWKVVASFIAEAHRVTSARKR
jgi:hypothetical protein